jgi:hypothetical protein
MFKAIIFFVLGCAATYLYFNPGDIDGMMQTGKNAIHDGAAYIQDITKN